MLKKLIGETTIGYRISQETNDGQMNETDSRTGLLEAIPDIDVSDF